TIAAAEQQPDWLARNFAENIPKGNVDSADGVSDRTTATLPKRILMHLLRDAFGLDRGFAHGERGENFQGAAHQRFAGENAADAKNARFIGEYRDQRVNAIIAFQLVGPAALRRSASQPTTTDLTNLHGCRLVFDFPQKRHNQKMVWTTCSG